MRRQRKLCGKHSKLMPVESFLHDLGQPWRRSGPEAWGLTLPDVGGRPLDVGLAIRGPSPRLLTLQAPVCGAGLLPAEDLLHRNRRLTLVRFTCTQAGEVWLQGELPWPVTDPAVLDLALAGLVAAAQDARYAASASRMLRSR
jgi:hypothetical protein